MKRKKKIHGNTGKKHALKMPELRRTEMIRLAVTAEEKAAFEKAIKRGERSKWLRGLIFKSLTVMIIGAAQGVALALQV